MKTTQNASGLVLGYGADGAPYRFDMDGHVVTVATQDSGKMSASILPNVVGHDGPVVMLDNRGRAHALLREQGRLPENAVLVGPSGVSINILGDCEPLAPGCAHALGVLANAILLSTGKREPGDGFKDTIARRVFVALHMGERLLDPSCFATVRTLDAIQTSPDVLFERLLALRGELAPIAEARRTLEGRVRCLRDDLREVLPSRITREFVLKRLDETLEGSPTGQAAEIVVAAIDSFIGEGCGHVWRSVVSSLQAAVETFRGARHLLGGVRPSELTDRKVFVQCDPERPWIAAAAMAAFADAHRAERRRGDKPGKALFVVPDQAMYPSPDAVTHMTFDGRGTGVVVWSFVHRAVDGTPVERALLSANAVVQVLGTAREADDAAVTAMIDDALDPRRSVRAGRVAARMPVPPLPTRIGRLVGTLRGVGDYKKPGCCTVIFREGGVVNLRRLDADRA